ncbi:MAG: cation diffusion facilitator family transporter [Candidatus Pacebacteria bacterium]|nr:cation diffusion facilitator family transporter [Candidatus Paceibacterota bacterium]
MKQKVALISILINIFLTSGKLFIGFISRSTAILAEGIHSLMDIFTSIISYFGIKIAEKPADKEHPYGHYKFETMVGLIITLVLLGTGGGIIYESYQGFLNPSMIKVPFLAFGIMIVSAFINEIMARLKIHFGKKENSIALLSDGFHSRVDVYTSVTVFIGLLFTKYWIYTDSCLAFLIGLYVIKQSFSLGKETIDSLLDVSAGSEIEQKIQSIVEEKDIMIEDLKTQKKGSIITANLEIKLPNDLKIEEATKISENLKQELIKKIENLSYVVIQIKSYKIETGFYKPILGKGFGWQRKGKFKEELKEARGEGPGGYCICSQCGYEIVHEKGVPCSTLRCPKCQINLIRK